MDVVTAGQGAQTGQLPMQQATINPNNGNPTEDERMSMKDIMNPEYDAEHPRKMSRIGWWFRIIGGAVVLAASLALSITFVLLTMQLWWWRAWGIIPQVLIIAIVLMFVAGVIWCYVAGLKELIQGKRDGSLVLVDDHGEDEEDFTVEEQIKSVLTGSPKASASSTEDAAPTR